MQGSKSYSRPNSQKWGSADRWPLRIAATDFALNLAFWKMGQFECSGTKMGCSGTVLFRAHRKKIRGNTACTPIIRRVRPGMRLNGGSSCWEWRTPLWSVCGHCCRISRRVEVESSRTYDYGSRESPTIRPTDTVIGVIATAQFDLRHRPLSRREHCSTGPGSVRLASKLQAVVNCCFHSTKTAGVDFRPSLQ